MRRLKIFPRTLPVVAFTALFIACSSSKEKTLSRTEKCREKFAKAQQGFDDEKYWIIKEDLEDLLYTCTGTGYMEKGQFMLAESHFLLEEWIEARAEFNAYLRDYPNSPDAEEAAFKKAICGKNLSNEDSRDDSNTELAIRDFRSFLSLFPNSKLQDSAQNGIHEMRDRQARKDFDIARLYLNMKEPQAAAIYLKDLLDDFPKSSFRRETVVLLVKCYTRLAQFDHAEEFISLLQNDFPSDETKEQVTNMRSDVKSGREKLEARLEKERLEKQYLREES